MKYFMPFGVSPFFMIFMFFSFFTSPVFHTAAEGADENLPTAAETAHVWSQTHEAQKTLVPVRVWEFQEPESLREWKALHGCALRWSDGALCVDVRGEDPYFLWDGVTPFEKKSAAFLLRFTVRSTGSNGVSVYWTDDSVPNFSEERHASARNAAASDGLNDVDVTLETPEIVRRVRLDPSIDAGTLEIRKIECFEVRCDGPQLETLPMESGTGTDENAVKKTGFPSVPQTVRVKITNPRETPAAFRVNGKEETFKAGESRIFTYVSHPERAMERCRFCVECDGFTPICREMILVHDVKITNDWKITSGSGFSLCVSPDGAMAYITRENPLGPDCRKIAAVAPLNPEKVSVRVVSDRLEFHVKHGTDSASGADSVEIPALRLPGTMQYAVVPGVEILEKGEWSSSKADLIIAEYLRIRPTRTNLTQTWMGIITEDGAFRLHWNRPAFQPLFAVPNYFDTTPDARLSLEIPTDAVTDAGSGSGTDADVIQLYISPSADETAFLQAAADRVLAEGFQTETLKCEQETFETYFARYREQLENGPIHSEAGWGHCAGKYWGQAPQADIASALWRVGGDVPDFQFQPGGGHVENNTIFFLRGQAQTWLRNIVGNAESVLKDRQPDGSWHYNGKYACTHFEDTALGVCVRPIWILLQAYAATGTEKYRDAALESLAYCRRFHVARGAQCWEMPLHTPDPLAAAYAIRSYVMAFRITGDAQYLNDARRWALEGLTYMYVWDDIQAPNSAVNHGSPWQYGAYIGVLGATNWKAPNWMGRPVQWIGTVYAYALLEFADVLNAQNSPENTDSDAACEAQRWFQAAEAITASTERQVYPDGEFAGLLPDSVDCTSLARYPWNINPSVPIALRLRLRGEQDGVRFFWNDAHRVASPFPVFFETDGVRIQAPDKDTVFQILLDGSVVDVLPGSVMRQVKFSGAAE